MKNLVRLMIAVCFAIPAFLLQSCEEETGVPELVVLSADGETKVFSESKFYTVDGEGMNYVKTDSLGFKGIENGWLRVMVGTKGLEITAKPNNTGARRIQVIDGLISNWGGRFKVVQLCK